MALFKSPAKEGPGVSKHEAEKRGPIKFFELFFRYYGKLFSVGFLKLLLDLPVITSGLGNIGSARVARNAARGRHLFGTDFSDAIKENWKQALAFGIINNILSAISIYAMLFFYGAKDSMGFIYMVLSALAFMVITFMRYYGAAIVLMFNVSLGQLYKDCFLLAFAGAKRNFIIFFGHIAMYFLIICPMFVNLYVGLGIAICLFILIAPPFSIYLTQYNIFPVLYKYLIEPFMKNHPGEGLNTLRELGLVEEYSEPLMKDDME